MYLKGLCGGSGWGTMVNLHPERNPSARGGWAGFGRCARQAVGARVRITT
jgi:hypothetical protein